MDGIHYTLGLDIGIASIGWAVVQNDLNGEPVRIQDLGVRIFDKAEQPKTGASLAAPRRAARSMRRQVRRHRHRLERIRYLLEQSGIMTVEEILAMYSRGGFECTPYQLRAEALDRVLTREEAVRILIHLAQRRGYKSNSTAEEAKDEKESGKIKSAIQENHARMSKNGYRTIGEMLWRDTDFWTTAPDGSKYFQPRNKSGDYKATVARSDMVSEIQEIFARQRSLGAFWATTALEESYLAIFTAQRSFDEGPGGNSPFRGGISAKVGPCFFEKEESRAAKACYTFEKFKLLQDINHIRICQTGGEAVPLDASQRETLYALAMKSDNLTFGQIRKKLGLASDQHFNVVRYQDSDIEKAEKQKWPQMQSYHKMRKVLDNISKGLITTLNADQLDTIAAILTCHKSDVTRSEKLNEAGIPKELYPQLLKLSFSKFGNISLVAMNKLIPYLEKGVRYDEACREVYGDHRQIGCNTRKSRLTLEDMEEISNPVVRRAVSQTLKVINAVVRTYGSPDLVRIELAREMGKSFDERTRIQKKQDDNRKNNERAKEQIQAYKGDLAHVSGLDIVKFKLWQEQNETCLYSGKHLDIQRLFEPGYVDVDHIIPYSRCFDDSYNNKVLVLSSENRQKGNRLPYEHFGNDEARWHDFEVRVGLLRNFHKRQKLLMRSFDSRASGEFIERNLRDTQYITTAVANLVRTSLAFAPSRYSKRPVETINGAVTSMLRNRWGLTKIREEGDLHHCMDAVVVAVTSAGMVKRLTDYHTHWECRFEAPNGTYADPATGELLTKKVFDEKYSPKFPEPWDRFRSEVEARMEADANTAIHDLHLSTYESGEDIHSVFVSRMPNHKVTGAAHKDTIRALREIGDTQYTVTKTALSALKLSKDGEIEGYFNKQSDLLLYNALIAQLKKYGGDGAKAFPEGVPFYKPKKDGTPGPKVDKIKICEKASLTVSAREGGGVAANGSMVRIDIFYIEDDGYYMVPIYVADTKKSELPNRAVIAHKPYNQWKEMKDQDFLFSLYPGDLIRVQKKEPIKFTVAKGGTGEKEIYEQDVLCYYGSANISTGSISAELHDRSYSVCGLGIKTLLSIKKYQVDILGNYYEVKQKEVRMKFL